MSAESLPHEAATDAPITIEADPELLRRSVGAIRQIVGEATLHFDGEGIHVNAVDPANIGMVDVTVPAGAFESYRTDVTDELALGVDLSSFETILPDAEDSIEGRIDAVTLTVAPDDISVSYDTGTVEREGTTKTIDPSSMREGGTLPEEKDDVTFAAVVDLKASEFINAVTTVEAVDGHHLEIRTVGEDCWLLHDGGKRAVGTKLPETVSARLDGSNADVESLYLVENLGPIADGVDTLGGDDVTLRLGQEVPLQLDVHVTYPASGWAFDCSYALAPRIRPDSEDGDSA